MKLFVRGSRSQLGELYGRRPFVTPCVISVPPAGFHPTSGLTQPGVRAQDGAVKGRLLILSALLLIIPVFAEAPLVRVAPQAAVALTVPLMALGLILGFSVSWLGGAIFWGWFRLAPIWHLPIEAFALPLAVGGSGDAGDWQAASAWHPSQVRPAPIP